MSNEISYPMKPSWLWGLLGLFCAFAAVGTWIILDPDNLLVSYNPVIRWLGMALLPSGIWCLGLWLKAWPDRNSVVRISDDYVQSVGRGGRAIRILRTDIHSVSPRLKASGVLINNDQGVDLEIPWRAIRVPARFRANDEAADYFAELLGVPRRDPVPTSSRQSWKRRKGRPRDAAQDGETQD